MSSWQCLCDFRLFSALIRAAEIKRENEAKKKNREPLRLVWFQCYSHWSTQFALLLSSRLEQSLVTRQGKVLKFWVFFLLYFCIRVLGLRLGAGATEKAEYLTAAVGGPEKSLATSCSKSLRLGSESIEVSHAAHPAIHDISAAPQWKNTLCIVIK